MRSHPAARRLIAAGALAASATLAFTSCSAGSLGSSSGDEDSSATTITFLSGSTDTEVASAKALIAAFQEANPGITVKSDTKPGGSEGDNLV